MPAMTGAIWISILISGLLAVRVGSLAVSDLLDQRHPAISVFFNSANEEANLRIASAALLQGGQSISVARAAAVDALNVNPLSWRALQMLALVAEKDEQSDHIWPLLRQSAFITVRNDTNQAWLLFDALQARDWDRVIATIGRVYAVEKRFRQVMVQGVAGLLSIEPAVETLAAALGRDPEWRFQLLNELNQQARDRPGMARLYLAMTRTPAPPTPRELGLVLPGLYEASPRQAYELWLTSLPGERARASALLDNADFRYGISGLPFDWGIGGQERAAVRFLAQDHRRILQLEFFGGRQERGLLRRILALPPGRYSFTGEEQARGLVTPRGMAWRISCPGQAPLAETPVLQADTTWRAFAMSFEVAEDCPFQTLELSLLARTASEQEVAGLVAFSQLSLAEAGR
ncbi:MAG: hypothetical protein ACK4MV_07970 [Beijerinckiaceae bacterium]